MSADERLKKYCKFMNEEPKSIWKKSLHGPRSFFGWLILVPCLALGFSFLGAVLIDGAGWKRDSSVIWTVTAICAGIVFFTLFIYWLCCWRNFKRFVFGLACFITLVALFYAEENWRGQHAWEQYQREGEARGEKFDFKDFVPPPVPDDQNFALTPVVASSYNFILTRDGQKIPDDKRDKKLVNRLIFDLGDGDLRTNGLGYWGRGTVSDLKPWQNLYRQLATKTNLFAIPPQPQSPAADVLLALSKFDGTVAELRQASQLPASRFPLNYNEENPATILLPDLAAMKSSVLMLRLRALAELQNGQSEKALDDVILMFRLAEAIRTEPFLISDLVRIAMSSILSQPIYEGLARHQWSDAQLVALEAELAKLNFLADYQFVMRGERAMGCKAIDYIGEKDSLKRYGELSSDLSDNDDATTAGQLKGFLKAASLLLMPRGWFDQNKLFLARRDQLWIMGGVDSEKHLASPQKFNAAKQAFSDMNKYPARPWNFLAKEFSAALGGAGRKAAREQISVDLARTAIALERYRLAHGEFPESLDALAPQFIASVPHDVIGGEPLKYRREADGQFVLYSIGWNEKDDGGVTIIPPGGSQPKFEEGDWVWRYPTK